jgi:hypothetical protein
MAPAEALRSLNSPDKIREVGEGIYEKEYRANLERERRGDFVAIDVTTGKAYVAKHPEEALKEARKQAPSGIFHLIRIGSPGAFKVSYATRQDGDWPFGQRRERLP